MRWLDSITDSMDKDVSELQETVKDRGAWHAVMPGVSKSQTQLSDWTTSDQVSVTIQTSHPSPPALSLSQHQSLFQGVSSLHQVAKVLELQLSAPVLPMNIQGWLPLGLTGLISLLSKGLPRVFSITTIQKHQFFGAQPSLWFNSHIHICLLEKP